MTAGARSQLSANESHRFTSAKFSSCSPLILWLHHSTVTRPHSVT